MSYQGAVDFVGSMLSPTYYQNKYNRAAYTKSVRDSREDATTAYNRQVDMWHMTNEYNDPSAQRARLEAAGLSPHFQHNSAGGADAAMPAVTKATSQSALRMERVQSMLSMLGQYANIMGTLQGINKTKAEVDAVNTSSKLNVANAVLANKHSELYGTQTDKLLQDIRFGSDIHPYQLQALELGNRYKGVNIDKLLEDIASSKHRRALELDRFELDKSIFDLRKASQLFDQDLRSKNYMEGVRQFNTSHMQRQFQFDASHSLSGKKFEQAKREFNIRNRTQSMLYDDTGLSSGILKALDGALSILNPFKFIK